MARTTGPILAVGGIVWGTQAIGSAAPAGDVLRIPVATAVAAGCFALAERVWADGAVALAYAALVSVLFVRLGAGPAPVEVFLKWWDGGAAVGGGSIRPATFTA